MEKVLAFLPENPLAAFTVLLLLILVIPPIFEKIKLPGLVGLLVAGVVFGKNGLNVLHSDSESIELLSDIGKVYLMFVAGLEIDLNDFRRTKDRSLGFGLATFAFPLIFGTIVGRSFDFSWNSSVLIGSLFSSHTLLGYPIVQRLGIVRNQAVTVTIGATIFTDIAALLVLAICVSIHQGEFSAGSLALQLFLLAVYVLVVLFGMDWAGKQYFRKTGDEESNQFLFVLIAVFLAAVGAQIINVDKIVGAFLAGLAVNDVVGKSPVKEKVEFVGGTLFIPIFFVNMGLLLDIPSFLRTFSQSFSLVVAVVLGLISSKLVAALAVKPLYRYRWDETLTMWSLSLPQVAATLAAALAAYQSIDTRQQRLIPETVFNSVIVLMLVTAILGPILTARFARTIPPPRQQVSEKLASDDTEWQDAPLSNRMEDLLPSERSPFTVLVPTYNPETQRHLLEMGALIAQNEGGTLIPLSIAAAHVHMDDPQLDLNLRQSQKLLQQAEKIGQSFNIRLQTLLRIDDDIALGISRAARETNAHLIVMGWSRHLGIRARLLGNVVDSVFWASHCPIAVMRLTAKPSNIHNVLVPVKDFSLKTLKVIEFAQIFAESNRASVTLLHVSDRKTPPELMAGFKSELAAMVGQTGLAAKCKIKVIPHDDVAKVILRTSEAFDMVILRSVRRRTVAGLAVSDVTTEVVKRLNCSLVLFGEPHS